MKKLVLLVATFAIFSCKNEPKIEYILFSGKIENPKGDKIVVSRNDFKKEITIKEDGTFTDTLHTDKGYYSLSHGRERTSFFISSGDDLKLSLDTNKFDETLAYTGKGAANNNYLAGKFLANENFNALEVYASEEADFLKKIEEAKKKIEEVLKNTKDVDADFVVLEKKNINYEYLTNLARYPTYHSYYAKKENFEPSKELLADLDKVDYDNTEDFANFSSYKELVTSYYMDKVYKDSLMTESIDLIKGLKSQNIKNDLASELAYGISPSNKKSEKIYNTIQTISDKEELKKEVTKKYNKIKKLITGKESPKFDYENHKGGKTKLDDLNGKYVYIDVWATWCGPCIAEIPSLKKVEADYHNKNIEFVSVSIDTPKAYETWKKMVTDKNLGGIQLIADDARAESSFINAYSIETIPRFILIDPNGKIVNADAPRPSSPKLIELFNELKI
jgi:thiol-disulfide isomerase/thioredoxin